MYSKIIQTIRALQDEVPPPTVTVTDQTNTTTTTSPPWNPPAYTPPPDMGVWISLLLFAGIFLVFAYMYYRRGIGEYLERLKVRHFILSNFLEDTEVTDLSDYNRKYGFVIIIGFVGMIAVPSLSVSLIPIAFSFVRGIITIMGYGLMILFLWNFLRDLSHREIKSMQNAVWFEVEFYVPSRGTFHKVWKKTEPEKQIVLSDKQYSELADNVIENAERYGHEFKKNEKENIKQALIGRLRKMFIYRGSVRGGGQFSYKLLVILKHSWNEVVNPNTEELFHKTTEVVIKRSPHHMVYIGESDRIFEDLGDKGSPEMRQLTMGVVMSIVDRIDIGDLLTEGKFDAPTYWDSVAAQLLNYYEQEATTAEFVNGKINALNKRDKEYEDLEQQKDEESQAQFNTFLRVFNRLFHKHQQRGAFTSLIAYAVVFFFVYWALFSMLGWMG